MADWLAALPGCVAENWPTGFGDPTALAWVTVAAYAVVSILCAGAAVHSRQAGARVFWIGLCLALAFLSVNKQLDLQFLLQKSGKCLALEQGWYRHRHFVRASVVGAILIGLVFLCGFLVARLRGNLAPFSLAIAGLGTLQVFIVGRAIVTQHIGEQSGLGAIAHFPFRALELPGIFLIGLNAVIVLRRQTTSPDPMPGQFEDG